MAGEGRRFSEAGYMSPKPLLEIDGRPMFELVIRNLMAPAVQRVVLLSRDEWDLSASVASLSSALGIQISNISVSGTTDGPAGTVELAESVLDQEAPVVVANSDQYVSGDLSGFYEAIEAGAPGVILAMQDDDPKWSYVRVDGQGNAAELREKVVISPLATVGIYAFSSVRLMLDAFRDMRDRRDMTNGEYYVAPSYRYLIEQGAEVRVIDLGPIGDVMHGMGIPQDYEAFLEGVRSHDVLLPWSRKLEGDST
jgi:dTDP-glucose pyrophosphorylase